MTLMELINQYLVESGVEEAVSVRVTFNDGETLVIASESDPALKREVGDGSGVTLALLQSARAGFSGGTAERSLENVRADISLSGGLLNRTDAVANEMEISRSRLVSVALEEFLRKYENQRLLEKLNRDYEEPPEQEEKERLRQMSQSHRRLVEGQW